MANLIDGTTPAYCVDKSPEIIAALIAGLNSVQATINANGTLTNIADVKASVPYAAVQNQLAMCQSTGQIIDQVRTGQASLERGNCDIMMQNSEQTLRLQKDVSDVGTNVDKTGTMLLANLKDEHTKTRELINENEFIKLNRQLSERKDEIIELRYNRDRERDRHENQLLLAQNSNILGGIMNTLNELTQVAKATNSNVIVGNSGPATTGANNASPTTVRA